MVRREPQKVPPYIHTPAACMTLQKEPVLLALCNTDANSNFCWATTAVQEQN